VNDAIAVGLVLMYLSACERSDSALRVRCARLEQLHCDRPLSLRLGHENPWGCPKSSRKTFPCRNKGVCLGFHVSITRSQKLYAAARRGQTKRSVYVVS
jgi:hypothetical protein